MIKREKKARNSPNTVNGILSHLGELRSRLLFLFLVWGVLACFVWIYASDAMNFLLTPVLKYSNDLIFLESQGAFTVQLSVVFWLSFSCLIPFIFWQFYSFAFPGLFKNERVILLFGFFFSILLFFSGAFVSFYFMLPSALYFFMSFESISEFVRFQPMLSGYISLVFQMMFVLGLAFQTPLILALLCYRGILSHSFLLRIRPYVWVGAFTISAIVTPPDPMSQVILALPMVVFYELCILIMWLVSKGRSVEVKS